MANFFDFSSDTINIFIILLDSSGSMEDDERNVKRGMKDFIVSFENFPEANSVAVSISRFNDDFYPGEFRLVKDLDIRYSTNGRTALFYSIVKASEYLNNYVREVTERKKCPPRVTFICFSDGEPCGDMMSESDARRAIEDLNYSGATTVFVAFGNAINSEFGKRLGFMSTTDVTSSEVLEEFLGEKLSESCKEQSRSLKALGENFFSQAVDGNKSEGYSQTTMQALEDDEWIGDI